MYVKYCTYVYVLVFKTVAARWVLFFNQVDSLVLVFNQMVDAAKWLFLN